ncbi:hypothetical protein THRCLA_09086 [Thraustotheca clavata]|uniref:Uncharacterized protein n=1 Tax=Thraustotheca clavata TaxID=74557 RepID=A0A1V9YZR2_9STRA|nr:hypothetical protein THRCLA_09086 [Thraustotheca clavata]
MHKSRSLPKRLSLNLLSPKASSPDKAQSTKERLRLIPPAATEGNQLSPESPSAEDDVSAVIHDILATLTRLIHRLDGIKQSKLRSIKLGGELRGLLGKAEDEFGAHQDSFHKHAHVDGLQIQLQNFLASLHGLEPVIDSIQKTKFLVNTFVKRNVEFAFQEINSYYNSIFTELSLAVAHASGSAAEAAILASMKSTIEPQSSEEKSNAEMLFQTGQQYFFGHGRAQNYHQAFIYYKQAAEEGNIESMVCLAQFYRDGKVVEIDTEAAIEWSTRAAVLGSVEGMYALGELLMRKAKLQPQGIRQQETFALAMVRLTQAGEQGHREAQYSAGYLYQVGALGQVDLTLAKEWYLKASNQHHHKAQEALGCMCYEGIAMPLDKAQAAHYFQLATQGDLSLSDAWYYLGLIYSKGEEVPVDKIRAKRCFQKAAQLQHNAAQIELATMLLASENTQPDSNSTAEALKWLLQVDPPTPTAQYLLGTLFESNEFLHIPTAIKYYTLAAREGHGEAAHRAAKLYYSGYKSCDVLRNKRLAFEMFHIAASVLKDKDDMNALGLMYEDGEGCMIDLEMAAQCFREAADRNSVHGHFNLACLLRSGRGVAKDIAAAKKHFEKAMELGHTQAQQYLQTTM